MNGIVSLGLFLTASGCVSFYMASPNQRLLSKAWPTRLACALGAATMASGFIAFMQFFQVATALFVLVIWSMVLFVFLPYLGAFLVWRKGLHK